jgi:hypothetical protein
VKPSRSCLPTNGALESEVIAAVRSGRLFGMVMVDIGVPDELKARFHEMPPIFKTAEVGRADVGEYMRRYCERNGMLQKPSRMLISSYKGERMLFVTPLLAWYLERGLVVDRVHMVLEWDQRRCFEPMMSSVADLRRKADKDPSQSMVGNSAKLLANSAYGKLCEDRSRFRYVRYVGQESLVKEMNKTSFCDAKRASASCYGWSDVHPRRPRIHTTESQDGEYDDPVLEEMDAEDEETEQGEHRSVLYEVSLNPKRINVDQPIQIPFSSTSMQNYTC